MDGATWDLIRLIAGWSMAFIGLGALIYIGWASRRDEKQLESSRARLEKLLTRERIARLRHRDFRAFCTEVNNARAASKQQPIPEELLRKVQYNLMYTIDED